MPVGSAASLPLPQVPLSPFPRARREKRPSIGPHVAGATAPPRLFPLPRPVDDPPQGRVLLASADAAAVLELQRLLRESGYRMIGPAGSAGEVGRLVRPIGALARPIDCALVDLGLPDAARVADRLADERIPLLWLASRLAVPTPAQATGPVVSLPCDRAALLAAIAGATRPASRTYPLPPPQPVWPRVFPQL